MPSERDPISSAATASGLERRRDLRRWLVWIGFCGAAGAAFQLFTGPIDTPYMTGELGARLFWPAFLAVPTAAFVAIAHRDRQAGIRMFCAIFSMAAGVVIGGVLGSTFAEQRLEQAVKRAQRAIEADIRAGRTEPTFTAIAPFSVFGPLDSESGRVLLMLFGEHGPPYEVAWNARAMANQLERDP